MKGKSFRRITLRNLKIRLVNMLCSIIGSFITIKIKELLFTLTAHLKFVQKIVG